MKFISDFIKGILIGAGGILPGISSGVLCVIFGIYEKLLNSVICFFKDVKNNFKFLLPIILGGGVGVIIFSKLLQYLLNTFALQTKGIFIGLILGGVPLILKQIKLKEKSKISLSNIIFLILALIVGISSVFLEKNINVNIDLENVTNTYLIMSGLLMSVGIVVPGVSSTIILMLMGTYNIYLSSVSSLNFSILIPMGVGIILGSFIFMKIIKYLLEKFYTLTFFAIIGFTLGSIFVLLPEIVSILDLVILIISISCGYIIMNIINIKE